MVEKMVDALLRPHGGARARAWSLYAIETRRMTLGTKDRETGNAHAPLNLAESAGAHYLVVWDDGSVSRGPLERRHLESDVDEALTIARAAAYDDPDAAYVLGPSSFPEVELYSEEAALIADGDAGLLTDRLARIRQAVDAEGFRTWSGSFHAGASDARLVTSAGLDVSGRGTSVGWHVAFDGELGTGDRTRAPEPAQDFDARLDRLVQLVRLLREPAETSVPDGGPMILHPDVVEELVLQTILHNLDGSVVAHGDGAFRREQFGSAQAVFREDLSLRLDPLRPLRIGSYRFSAEGVPASRCTYIDHGRLATPLLDLKYARRLGLPPTPLPHSMDALYLEGPKPLRLDEALALAAGGSLVLSVLGVHTQDASSGDFSLSAPQVLRIGPRGLRGRARTTIAGNVFDILRSDATRLVEFEGEHTPGLLCEPSRT